MIKQIIRCPVCQTEYLPAEIYLPDSFLGKPKEVRRDLSGKIVDYFGKSMDLIETYRCDHCNSKFTVEANVKFYTTSKVNNVNKHKTKLSKPSLFMDED